MLGAWTFEVFFFDFYGRETGILPLQDQMGHHIRSHLMIEGLQGVWDGGFSASGICTEFKVLPSRVLKKASVPHADGGRRHLFS